MRELPSTQYSRCGALGSSRSQLFCSWAMFCLVLEVRPYAQNIKNQQKRPAHNWCFFYPLTESQEFFGPETT